MWIIATLLIIIFSFLWYLTTPFYWKKKNIPYLNPLPIFGDLIPIIHYGMVEYFKILNRRFPGHKYYGMHFLTRPTLYVKDPKIIQRILVTDFEHFSSHGLYSNQDRDPAGSNLFLIYGQQWKEMRGKLSQYFTPAKIKAMMAYADLTMPKITAILDKKIEQDESIEIYGLLKNTTTDIITQSIFGVKSDAFENEKSLFSRLASNLFTDTFTLRVFTSITSSKLFDLFKMTAFESDYTKLIKGIVIQAMEYRKKENIYVQDFLQGMIELLEENDKPSENKYFPDSTRIPNYDINTVISQAIILHVGGVETSALTMSFLLYELALNPEIQEKCRHEINSIVAEEATVTIEDTQKFTYLAATIQETMRIHSPFIMISRECTKEYKVPDSDLTIEPGTFILMSPISTHMEEENFPEPHIFRPERFLDEEKNSIKPGTYFPFGIGPRTCIGMSFAQSEMKLVISRLLQRYEFYISSETQVPLQYGKFLFFATPSHSSMLLGVRTYNVPQLNEKIEWEIE